MAQPVRFVWQTDEQGRFTLASEEFMRLVGDQTAALLGRPWREIAEMLGLDPAGQIAQALTTQDTWSAITVSWPTEKNEHALAVELSGLPVFDRERMFRGYRGFGICKDAPPIASALPGTTGDADVPALIINERAVAAGAHVLQENVVRLRGNEARDAGAPSLSPAEHEAFREISRKLGRGLSRRSGDQRSTAAPVQHETEGEAAEADSAQSAIEQPARASDIRLILDRVAAGILVYRVSQLLYANPSFLRWSGHPNLQRLIEAGGLDELFVEPLAAAGDADSERTLTVNLTGRDKSSLRCELLNIVWDGEPAHALFAEVGRDTKENDSLRETSHRAEAGYSAKNAFIAHISHELRTPLNSIIGFAELMIEERLGALANARYREYLKDIHDSGTHLLSLVNDLLDLSRLEAGKFALTPEPLDVNEIVAHCVALMQPQAQRARVVMRSAPAAALPPVAADARSVRQMLFNLMANSLKFTPAGGQVIVSTSLNEGGAVLRVRDTGKGMSADHVEATMQAGQHWDGLPGRNGGLGLLLTKALAEANGATFRLASTPGSGTLVEIAFPASALAR